jgi:hypothetical protein
MECRDIGRRSPNEQGQQFLRAFLERVCEPAAARSFDLNELDDVSRRLPISRETKANAIRQSFAIQCRGNEPFDHLPPGCTTRVVQSADVG